MKKLNSKGVFTFYSLEETEALLLPYVDGGVKAGFPSPAADFTGEQIDLNQHLVKNKTATYCVKVKGNSMTNAGINDGDVLVVDKSVEPQDGKIAICSIDGEFTIKRIKIEKERILLLPANTDFNPIEVTPENELIVFGIVMYIIKKAI